MRPLHLGSSVFMIVNFVYYQSSISNAEKRVYKDSHVFRSP